MSTNVMESHNSYLVTIIAPPLFSGVFGLLIAISYNSFLYYFHSDFAVFMQTNITLFHQSLQIQL